MRQLILPQAKGIIPPRPTLQSERVAYKIAREIVIEVNLDEVYWTAEELDARIFDVQQEIITRGKPAFVFERLYHKQPFRTDEKRERVTAPYGWEGIDEHCQWIADEIAERKLAEAVESWNKRYAE